MASTTSFEVLNPLAFKKRIQEDWATQSTIVTNSTGETTVQLKNLSYVYEDTVVATVESSRDITLSVESVDCNTVTFLASSAGAAVTSSTLNLVAHVRALGY